MYKLIGVIAKPLGMLLSLIYNLLFGFLCGTLWKIHCIYQSIHSTEADVNAISVILQIQHFGLFPVRSGTTTLYLLPLAKPYNAPQNRHTRSTSW